MDKSKQVHDDVGFKENYDKELSPRIEWAIMKGGNGGCESESMESSSPDSQEEVSSSSSSTSAGPLYELNDLMSYLPIKKGLSKYYQGKSQSFSSLANVKNLEDLAKKGSGYGTKRMKSCKSYGGNLDGRRYRPKATIAKKEVFKRLYFN